MVKPFCEVRIYLGFLLEIPFRDGIFTDFGMQQPKSIIGLWKQGIQFQRPQITTPRLCHLTKCRQRKAQIHMTGSIVLPRRESFPVGNDGFLVIACGSAHQTQIVCGLRKVG